jgi:hypothetical protein
MTHWQRETTMVVIEYGASWPRWLDSNPSESLVVVAQHYEGKPTALLEQIKSRLVRLQQEGSCVKTLVFVCNANNDAATRSARALVARGLLGPLGSVEGSQLVLSNDTVREPAGMAFSALVATLKSDAAHAGVRLGLRLGSSPTVFGSIGAFSFST